MEKRWLLDMDYASTAVLSWKSKDNTVRCTEVRLVTVDAVVCAKGTREWAVVMAMRGKKVTHKTHLGNDDNPHWASIIVNHEDMGEWYELPAEEPLKCPACGGGCSVAVEHGQRRVVCRDPACDVRGPNRSTESEAREAFRRMGGGR